MIKFEADSAGKKPKTPLQRVPSSQMVDTTPTPLGVSDKNPRFQTEDYENIVAELEITSTREAILGSRKKTPVGQKVMSKGTAFTGLAGRISALYNSRMRPWHQQQGTPFVKMELTGRQMQQRYGTYKGRFMKARKWALNTGAGLTEKDRESGIKTIDSKLEQICPCFSRMEAIYAHRPNMTPWKLYSSLKPTDEQDEDEWADSSDSEDWDFDKDEAGDSDDDISVHAPKADATAAGTSGLNGRHPEGDIQVVHDEHRRASTPPAGQAETDVGARRASINETPDLAPASREPDATPGLPNSDKEPARSAQRAIDPPDFDNDLDFFERLDDAIKSPRRLSPSPEPSSAKRPRAVLSPFARDDPATQALDESFLSPDIPEISTSGVQKAKEAKAARGRQTIATRKREPLPTLNPQEHESKFARNPLANALAAGSAAKLTVHKDHMAMVAENNAWKRLREEERSKRDAANLSRQIKCDEDRLQLEKDRATHVQTLELKRAENDATKAADQLAWEKERYHAERLEAEAARNDAKERLQERLKFFRELKESGVETGLIGQSLDKVFE